MSQFVPQETAKIYPSHLLPRPYTPLPTTASDGCPAMPTLLGETDNWIPSVVSKKNQNQTVVKAIKTVVPYRKRDLSLCRVIQSSIPNIAWARGDL